MSGYVVDVAAGGHRRQNVPPELAEALRRSLIAKALAAVKPGGAATWRLRVADTDISYWDSTGTLYGSRSPSGSPAVVEAWSLIAAQTPLPYVAPTKPILIGLDESGTTEPAGPPIMVAAIVPSALAALVWEIVELADTKGKRHAVSYWRRLIDDLTPYGFQGLDFIAPDISTDRCETASAKPLLDAVYAEVLTAVFESRDPADCRVVVDNYGVGGSLCEYLKSLQDAGAEVVPSPASNCPRDGGSHADDRYVEVRAASVMARYRRELALETIPASVPTGTMNLGFREWVDEHRAAGLPVSSFVKKWAREMPS